MTETSGPLRDLSRAGEHHAELTLLGRILAEGLGLLRDGVDGPSHLAEIRDEVGTTGGGAIPAELAGALEDIRGELGQIRAVLEAGHEAGEAIRQEAEAVLASHAEAAENYISQVETAPEPDWHPFESVPAGTEARDLEDGGRLFLLASGEAIRVHPDGSIAYIGTDGSAEPAAPPEGREVTFPGGLTLRLREEAIRVTHEAAMIAGLPWDVQPERVAAHRYSAALPEGLRLEVDHAVRSAAVVNPSGTLLLLGATRIEGVGEEMEVHLIPNGGKGFAAMESGHRGLVEPDGTIHLGLKGGLDLVIRFPEAEEGDEAANENAGVDCREHEA